jgi:hypothetical protein
MSCDIDGCQNPQRCGITPNDVDGDPDDRDLLYVCERCFRAYELGLQEAPRIAREVEQ